MTGLEWIVYLEAGTRAAFTLAAIWALYVVAQGLRVWLLAKARGELERRDRELPPLREELPPLRNLDGSIFDEAPAVVPGLKGSSEGAIVAAPADARRACPRAIGFRESYWRAADRDGEGLCSICSRPWLEHRQLPGRTITKKAPR